MADTQKKPTKTVALITYVIAVVCLFLGLFLPLGPVEVEGEYNAVIMQIPHALACFGVNWDAGAELIYTFPVHLMGGNEFELGGLFILLYALVCVAALGALVAVLFGKKDKDTSINCAGVIEVLGTIVLSVLLFMEMTMFSILGGYDFGYSWSLALVIAFGGTLLMLIIQSIYHKGSSGVAKALIAVISGISVVFCVFSFAGILPSLAESILKDKTQLIDWTEAGPLGSVWYHLYALFQSDYGEIIKSLEAMDAAVAVFMLILGILIIVNFFLDICGLAKKTKRWMLLSNLIRYGLEVLLVLLVLILGGVVGNHSVGIVCYVLLVIAVLLTAINIIRFVTFKEEQPEEAKKEAPKPKAAAAPAPQHRPAPQPQPQPYAQTYAEPYEPYEPYVAPVAEEEPQQPEYTQPQQPQPQQPAAAPVAAQNGNVYTPVIYNGPRDEFIDTLSNEQRIEFARTFLERRAGDIQGVPEYVVDGDNDKFFQSLFIYYARVRGLVSDGLMNKFYEQVSAIKRD